MTDLSHTIGSDLEITPNGNFELASGADEGQQRVLRRLLTNPQAMPFHLDYGSGLVQFIGLPMNQSKISARITSQMRLERAVMQIPPPKVDVSASTQNIVVASIQYVDRATGDTSQLEFNTDG